MTLLKRLVQILLGLIVLLVIVVAAALAFGPLSITSVKAILNVAAGYSVDAPATSVVAGRLKVPQGFSVGRYAEGLPKIRFIEFSKTGDLLAVLSRDGQLVLLARDEDGDGRHNGKRVLLDELASPNDLEFYQDWLYVAESNAIGRIKFDHQAGETIGEYQRIIMDLPDSGNHRSKSIRIHDNKLYISVGSSCNVCIEEDERRGTIMEYDIDGSGGRIFAKGLRNSVGLDVAPWDNNLYATDNGRDMLGDDYPVCELNKIEEGEFYGWPYINAFGDLDPEFGEGQESRLTSARSPEFGFAPHNAPLGMRFIRKTQMPAQFQRTALVALHGSWNRSKADGYRVKSVHWDEDGKVSSKDFLWGFELDDDVIGRPVDVAEGPDGCVYVSDDYAGSVYRVCYQQSQQEIVESTVITVKDDAEYLALTTEQLRLSLVEGEALFNLHTCTQCHRFKSMGDAGNKSLDNLQQRYTMASLSEYFLQPNAPMPVYPLSEAERKTLAAYLLTK